MTRVAVVVVGDIGRSPRMQYHALSLANHGFGVDFIGYGETDLWPEVASHPKIQLRILKPVSVPSQIQNNFFFSKLYKAFFLAFALFWQLFTIPRPHYIFVQTPPAIPVLHLAHIICWLRWSRLVIDWHNYGHTILAMSKKDGPWVYMYKFYEMFFGRGAYYNLCVSNLMKEDLLKNWTISATVLYDCAPIFFRPSDLLQQHLLFTKYDFGQPPHSPLLHASARMTAFTLENKGVTRRKDRPVLIVSSTSWTKDEDFDILLEAMVEVDKKLDENFPQIRLVVTGKGDMKEIYEKKMDNQKLNKVKMYTTFLPYEDYVTLLGSADIGVCLHVSSSGIDLPMKVVDMFGCNLPVCAVKYPALSELVKHKKNGLIFSTPNELAEHILDLLSDFPNTPTLDKMRTYIRNNSTHWDEEWSKVALPIFQGKINISEQPQEYTKQKTDTVK